MANKLVNLHVTEISGVDKAANKRRLLLIKREGGEEVGLRKDDKPMKTENGMQFPAEAYLYVPDPEKPSTWKLRVWEDPEKKVTAAQVGRAIAALSPGGFRGQKVDLPAEEIPKIKAKLRRLWRQVNPDKEDEEMPEHIRKAGLGSELLRVLKGIIYGPETNVEARTFDQVEDEQVRREAIRNLLWEAFDTLRDSVYSILDDPEADKVTMLTQTTQQFLARLLEIAGAAEQVEKVGAKIAAHRLERLKAARDLLAEIIAEAEEAKPEEGVKKGEGEVNKEEVEALVKSQVGEVTKKLEALAGLPAKVEELSKLADTVRDLAGRLEALETAKGVRKSLAGQEAEGDKPQSLWAGVL